MHGIHLIGQWPRTQSVIPLSSAEAELNALSKAGSEALGVINYARELGIRMKPVLYSDSLAAQGILARRGSGKVKHLETKQLWLQERVRSGEITLTRVPRKRNPADLLTHQCSGQEMQEHLRRLSVECRSW